MTDFCTLADLEAALGVPSADPAAAELAIRDVSAAIRGFVGQRLELQTSHVLSITAWPGSRLVLLPSMHVGDVSSVVEDGVTLAVDTDYSWRPAGLLARVGRPWSSTVNGIVVTLTSGYAESSDEWAFLRTLTVSASMRRYQNTLRSAASGGASGIQSESMPDYQISFGVDLAGAYSMVLLPSEQKFLRMRFSKGAA